jgi:hypothetical protein
VAGCGDPLSLLLDAVQEASELAGLPQCEPVAELLGFAATTLHACKKQLGSSLLQQARDSVAGIHTLH